MNYAPSILQDNLTYCFLCGRSDEKLDRHEVFGASSRQKSKQYGLWVVLCHGRCHLYGVHQDARLMEKLHKRGQEKAMEVYGWSQDDFRRIFGKNYI